MEIEGEDGSRIFINGSTKEFGRGLGFPSDDRTVSRRHVSFEIRTPTDRHKNHVERDSETEVSFQVLGKNPIWLLTTRNGDIRVFRKFDKGKMRVGDQFCVSSKKPSLFTLKRIGFEREEEDDVKRVSKEVEKRERSLEEELAGSIQIGDGKLKGDEDLGFESLSVSDVDPVKEFGFVVLGREFDHYPKKMIRGIKGWNWFLEEPRGDSEDDDERKAKRGLRRKKKRDEVHNDEDWTGESEDDQVVIAKIKTKRARYPVTRSKDHSKPLKGMSDKKFMQKKTNLSREEDDDETDDTLGGFIVNDDDVEEDKEESDDDDEINDIDT